MTVITRPDGIKFVINSYREEVNVKKTALLKKELRALSNIHGKFAKFFYKDDKQRIEAVFSTEAGYLLGSSIWFHYGLQIPNLIYCEALPESDKALLVIVHEYRVYLETELPKANVITELASLLLLGDKSKFVIYISGDVPIAEQPTDGKFAFDSSMLESFQILDTPLYPTLEPDVENLLRPIEDAIRALNLPTAYTLPIIIGVCVLAFVGYLWKKAHPTEVAQLTPIIEVSHQNPYAGLQSALSTPAPTQIILDLTNQLDHLLAMPGWQVTTIILDKQANVTVYLISSGEKFSTLLNWGMREGYAIQPTTTGATLTKSLHLENRIAEEDSFSSAIGAYTNLYDSMNKLFPYSALSMNKIKSFSAYKQYDLTITLTNTSPGLLRQLAQVFSQQPITITSMKLALTSGLISGTIQFSILGL